MNDLIDTCAEEALKPLKKILASRGKLLGNFYFAGDTKGRQAGLVVTLTARDPKGAKATARGKKLRASIDGAKFARGTVQIKGPRLLFVLHTGSATCDHVKRAFKRSFLSDAAAPVKRLLKRALVGTPETAPEAIEDAPEDGVAEEELFSELSAKERADVWALIEQQDTLAAQNALLEDSFLSAAAADAEEADHRAGLARQVRWHEAQDPVDAEELAAARWALAEAVSTSPTVLAEPPSALPEDVAALVDVVLERFDQHRPKRVPRDRSTVPERGGGWGLRSQIAATMSALEDLEGNRDGIWGNEDEKAGRTGSLMDKNPLLSRLRQWARAGLSTRDEKEAIAEFRQECEDSWGQPVTDLDTGRLRDGELFAAQKALALAQLGRHPSEVTEDFVLASGSVAGFDLEAREVFTQRFKPTAPPTGNVVVISPGFQETGRHFYEQIQTLNAMGHDVVVMDHQWAGQSDGEPGGLDRGFGVARDVAAVAAYAQKLQQSEYGDVPGAQVALLGNSMGGGPGVLGALTLNDAGLIDLDGEEMPTGLSAVLQSPFLGASDNLLNDALAVGSRVPGVRDLAMPSSGVPVLTRDDTAAQKGAQISVLEDIRAQLQSMTAANEDLALIRSMIHEGKGPSGAMSIVHGDGDPLADPEQSRAIAASLGVELALLETDDHVLQQSPTKKGVALDALAEIIGQHEPGPEGVDVTDRFHSLIEQAKAGKVTLPEDAWDHIYLSVPGLFTERYPGYMDDNFARLDELGLDSGLIEIDTDAGVEENAAAIRAAVLDAVGDSGRKVVLTGHSKGGVDLSAAMALYPELQEHVHAVITMQAPFSGTPIGDLVKDNEALREAASLLVEDAWDGDIASLTDLSASSREAFLAEHPYPDGIPTVSLATSTRSLLAGMGIPAAVLRHIAGAGDGAVPMESAVLPGADAIRLEDMDHAGPVLPNPLGFCASQEAGDLTEVLITLVLEKARRMAPPA